VNGVFAVPGRALQHAFKPAAGLRKIAFTCKGPPRQRATDSSQDAAAPRTLPERLKGKCPTADADQQPGECKPLGGAVPPALVPYAGRCTVGGQVGLARRKIVRHAGRDASLGAPPAADGFPYIRRHAGNTPHPSPCQRRDAGSPDREKTGTISLKYGVTSTVCRKRRVASQLLQCCRPLPPTHSWRYV